MPQIEVRHLSKVFKVPEREGGLGAALRSLWKRRYREVSAVNGIETSVEPGEMVGFLGPNGAGKTTTLKMLSGLLHPTSGEARVMGFTPWKREHGFLRRISMVMGQRSQLAWDLPAADSFDVHLAVYQVEAGRGRRTRERLVELLEIGDVLKKPVRTLSLGERMKCELCISLLHEPAVMFLDEPTLGLDITMQARIRGFIAEYNRSQGATIILTSHYMADVTALCRRVIVIDKGQLLFDGRLAQLSERLAPYKVIAVDLSQDIDGYDFDRVGSVLAREGRKVTLRVPKAEAAAATTRLLSDLPVLDLTIEDPPIEDVIGRVFTGVL